LDGKGLTVVGIDPSLTCTGLAFVNIEDNKLFYSLEAIKIARPKKKEKGIPKKYAEVNDLIHRLSTIDILVRTKVFGFSVMYGCRPEYVFIEVPWQYRKKGGKTNTLSLMRLSLLVGGLITDISHDTGAWVIGLPSGGGIPKKEAGFDFLKSVGFNFTPNRGYDTSDALVVAIFGGWYFLSNFPRDIAPLTKVKL